MAIVLCVLASARSEGYTATLLDRVIEGIKSIKGVDVEFVNIFDYLPISPCISCWNCARNDDHRCTLDDSMGRMGEGELVNKVLNANGLFIAQPVYFTRPPASVQLFFERFYPFMWSGELNGLPFASLSQAANNGGTRMADWEMSKWAFTRSFKYIGGLPVHMVQYDEACVKARDLGKKLAEAALEDAEERFTVTAFDKYMGTDGNPWDCLDGYVDDLTNGTRSYKGSLVEHALSHGTVKKEEAVNLLRNAAEELKLMLQYYEVGDRVKAKEHLIKMRTYWSPATIKEFLDDDLNQ
ncbi:flavodoxin family protein [Candidatus Bathyarchaeota archaeon]|jgi:multimeric flavodoxin WrbA|nr:flavodoxin family protein [Candidatus Bathyarchaeota archaeon]MBT4321463.1 flavodoxin family protein [Candidatus Bathyarchaeota archaeon]MBT4424223.1 flavodoxin family protein [Candidatus Bathyarchaeota archaeon]MBT6605447.1 flavodoxin family protein [Candidatus Bathyarchaeota archaeon]MBT7187606.1 flavodoxin family protein [Candidatus Bathyarchaeota archaeon]